MPKEPKKKNIKINLPLIYPDLSHIKPPTRPAVEIMIENLHEAGRLQSLK